MEMIATRWMLLVKVPVSPVEILADMKRERFNSLYITKQYYYIIMSVILRSALVLVILSACAQKQPETADKGPVSLLVGAERMYEYLPLLQGKNVGLCVNHTSMVGSTHLLDTLLASDINIGAIYTPEHGFRGTADAGELIEDGTTGANIPVISLYGKNRKPSQDQLAGMDVVIFDIQDVGTRFYTYISTMHYVMEACAEARIPVIVLDRPNPNDFIDGPMLDTAFRSFVGMHPIPVVHGLTVGELANMINAEYWLADSLQCDLTVVPVANWSHGQKYTLPIAPSPNLPNQQAINWYPTLCFFEGTHVSVGRGTAFPFQVTGSPIYTDTTFSFTPRSGPGAKYPKHQDITCFGIDMRNKPAPQQLDIALIQHWYKSLDKEEFFKRYFQTLSGTDQFQRQIEEKVPEDEIRANWEAGLAAYKVLRKKYLLYEEK
jgi:uncharacterized protein YbbC (DUF1343 family)